MISLVEVYSASSRLTFDGGPHWNTVMNQAGCLLGGLLLILVFHRIPCKWFMLLPVPLLLIAVGTLFYTAVLGGGTEINDTHRWVRVMGFSIQPSEFGKVALITSTAVILAKTQTEKIEIIKGKPRRIVGAFKGKRYMAFTLIFSLMGLVCGLIFMDNVSTALMLAMVIVVMMFVGHVPRDLMLKGMAALTALGLVVVAISMVVPDEDLKEVQVLKRVVTVKHRILRMVGDDTAAPDKAVKTEAQQMLADENSQKSYAFIAIANSNVIGRGPGNSVQRDFLQHAESDFIYAIIIEELGIGGAIFVAFLYLALLMRVAWIAQRCTTFFPAFLVLGLGMMITLQALVNMSVAVFPGVVTGQPLPFISKGGTSIILTSFYIAMILSVSRYAQKKQKKAVPVEAVPNGETSEYFTDGAMA